MHPNPAFRNAPKEMNLRFAAEQGFGTLAVNGADGFPLLSHIPFLVDGDTLLFHLVRSNPIARQLKSAMAAKLAVTGPHSYLSPDWYGIDDQVPTWNYVAVHVIGQAELLPASELRDVIDRLSDHFEAQLLPKPIWKSGKMDADQMERMMRMIVPAQLKIEDVQGTWKLAQHKPEAARIAAATEMAQHGIGSEVEAIAALTRSLPEFD